MKTVFYVAVAHSHEAFNPTIVEKFEQKLDAECFAALMSKTKRRKYIVLEQTAEYETTQSK